MKNGDIYLKLLKDNRVYTAEEVSSTGLNLIGYDYLDEGDGSWGYVITNLRKLAEYIVAKRKYEGIKYDWNLTAFKKIKKEAMEIISVVDPVILVDGDSFLLLEYGGTYLWVDAHLNVVTEDYHDQDIEIGGIERIKYMRVY